MVRIANDILSVNDRGKVTTLALLGLSAVFDTIDHGILLSRLRTDMVITGTAVSRLRSYCTCHSHAVSCVGQPTSSRPITCGAQVNRFWGLYFQIGRAHV